MPGPGEHDPTPTRNDWLQVSGLGLDGPNTGLMPVGLATLSSGDTLSHAAPPSANFPRLHGYEILAELGRGGMGVVYQARQLGLNRLVALKMILAGPQARAEDLARFRAEAEAVAQLQHPNIVQVFDIGELHGLPFFSLEYVAGGSLQAHLHGQPQPAEWAAALVEQLAQAMHAAHERGIIHRDLKPANILLQMPNDELGMQKETANVPSFDNRHSTFGIAKITDFGLAKRLEVDSGYTRTGEILGTPSYMAPEQASGHTQQVDAAADIYALGTILYEVLTGRPPFQGLTPMETVLQVISEEPVPPRRLMPRLPVDLETICLKCLRKEPQQRYATALELANDLQRFRNGEPIKARPLSRMARMLRWCRRNPMVAALVGMVFLTMVAGTAVSLFFAAQAEQRAVEAEQEKQRANANFARARQAVKEYLVYVTMEPRLLVADFYDLRKKLLTTALPLYRELNEQAHLDSGVAGERADVSLFLANIYETVGDLPAAAVAYRQAIATMESHDTRLGQVPLYQRQRGVAYTHLGKILHRQGRSVEAEKHIRQGLALAEQFRKEQPHHPDAPRNWARGLGLLADLLADVGRYGEAEHALGDVLDTFQELLQKAPQDQTLWEELSNTQVELGTQLLRQGRVAEAEKEYLAARTYWGKEAKRSAKSDLYRAETARLAYQIGRIYEKQGRHSEAEREYRSSLELTTSLVEEFPSRSTYRISLGVVKTGLSMLLADRRQFAEAETQAQQALSILEPLTKSDAPLLSARRELGRAYHHMGLILLMTNRVSEARKSYHQSLAIWQAIADQQPANLELQHELASAHMQLGNSFFHTQEFTAAEKEYLQCSAILERVRQTQPGIISHGVQLGGCLCNLGNVYFSRSRFPESLAAYNQAAQTLEEVLRQDHKLHMARIFLRNVNAGRAAVLGNLNRPWEALDAADHALALDDGSQRPMLMQLRGQAILHMIRHWQHLLQEGNNAEALELAERFAKVDALNGEQSFNAALLCAQALPDAGFLADRWARLTVTFLQRGHKAGLFKTQRYVDQLLESTDFAAFRLRPEFHKWVQDTGLLPKH